MISQQLCGYAGSTFKVVVSKYSGDVQYHILLNPHGNMQSPHTGLFQHGTNKTEGFRPDFCLTFCT